MSTSKPEITSVQVWPSGRAYDYMGDFNGPPAQRRLRKNDRCGGELGAWQMGTDEEWKEVRRNVRAQMYSDRDILCVDSMLVSDLLRSSYDLPGDLADGFSVEEIRNLYPDPDDWDADQCREWLSDCGIELDQDDLDNMRQEIRDNAEPAEVYEWWRVTGWLCDQLHAIGEVTIDNGYGHWWGRQATGQGYLMDGTLQEVSDLFD